MPKGILIALPIILVLYLFVSLGSSGIIFAGELTPEETSSSVGLILTLAAKINVPAAAIFAFAAFSAAGTGYAMISMCFKQMKVLANDNVLPAFFKKEAFGFNYFNGLVILLASMTIGGVMVGTSEVWTSSIDCFAAAGLGIILVSALLPAGIIALYLRIKIPALTRPFKTPVYFIVFPLAIILSLYLIVINFWEITNLWPGLLMFLVITVLCSLLLYFFSPKEQETTGLT
jgi:amino acid transporter